MSSNNITKKRKLLDTLASVGMLLVAAALAIPLVKMGDVQFLSPFKWVFAAGALLYTVARVLNPVDSAESLRLRRLHRMQAWAGIAFVIAAFFWFYNEERFGNAAGTLQITRQTILFALVGAVLQIVSSWMIFSREKKEKKTSA
ncbi:MAG: hypothetical protein J6C59_03990 [Muribaculaceae bacterium]|nr:hypothetical protein [Muribaculaceae bacterium]